MGLWGVVSTLAVNGTWRTRSKNQGIILPMIISRFQKPASWKLCGNSLKWPLGIGRKLPFRWERPRWSPCIPRSRPPCNKRSLTRLPPRGPAAVRLAGRSSSPPTSRRPRSPSTGLCEYPLLNPF
eukprot:33810-Prorocentrum_minimum.AAC.1